MRIVISTILAVILATGSASARGSFERATLGELPGVRVRISGLEPDGDFADLGLPEITVETNVQLQLRQNGIRILPLDGDDETHQEYLDNGSPEFGVHFNLLRSTTQRSICAYSFHTLLRQEVQLSRDPSIYVSAATWTGLNSVGIANCGDVVEILRSGVRDSVDFFINAFLAANEKKASE